MTIVRLGGRATALALALASSAAVADTKIGASAGVTGGIASNPYGFGGGGTGSGTLAADFAPIIVISAPTGKTTFSGRVNHTEYFKRYKGTTDYSLGVGTSQQLSELTSVNASLGYSSYVRNGLYPILDPTVPVDPNDPNVPPVVDPTAGATFADRTVTLNAGAGLNATLSPRDSIGVSARGVRTRFPNSASLSSEYDSYGGAVTYNRAVGQNTSIGVSFDLGRIIYSGGIGDSTQYSPMVQFSTRLAERLSVNASAGLTFSQLSARPAQTSFSGSVGLCYIGDISHFCLNGSRRVSATALSGTSNVTSIGATYSLELDERSTVSASASYAKSRSIVGLGGQNTDYGYGSVAYSRQIMQRLSAVASINYSNNSGLTGSSRANVSGTVGLRYRLGEI